MEHFFDLRLLSNSGIQKMSDIGLFPFFLLMLTSLIASFFISHLYVKFYGSKGTGSTLHRAFPLLGVAITAIFVCLQFSIPLSLGLLGALSIVRFRTPIKDPEEVGFILLVIATSITCATFNMPFLVLILFIALVGLVILKKDKKFFRKNKKEGLLISKVPLATYQNNHEKVLEILKSDIEQASLDSITEDSNECQISYVFTELDENTLSKIKSNLTKLDNNIKVNVFFNQTTL